VVKTDGGFLELEDEDRALFTAPDAGIEELDCPTEDALLEHCADAAALLVLREPITARVLDGMPECRVITRFGVGLDTVDVPAATERGVRVTNVPDANFEEVATHALALILGLCRRLFAYDRAARAGNWRAADVGAGIRRLDRLQLGIVGVGRNGGRLATMAGALGMSVVATDPYASDETIAAAGARAVALDELLATSDVVSLHLPLTPETRHLIDRSAIESMKEGAMLVNAARGGLLDEDALRDALESGALSGAALDSFETEPLPADSALAGVENLILTPHAAHYSRESFRETIHKACQDVARVLRGEDPHYPVN
jgi:phosphoglycerate dehydrogenase-like enzyme